MAEIWAAWWRFGGRRQASISYQLPGTGRGIMRRVPGGRGGTRLVLNICMPVEGEYEPSTAAWVRDQVELYESSGGTQGTTLRDTGLPVVIVTNRGAKSGKVHKTPVMRVEHDGRYAMVASKGGAPAHPLWYYNVRANPLVEVQDGAHKQDMTAREISGQERADWWERAVAAYPPYAEYQQKTTRQIPVFVLEPVT
jgi:F420H(2)-dependent quinone reductase